MPILQAPYASQWTLSSQASVNDCGAATLHSALRYLANTDVRIDDMTAWIGTKGLVTFVRLAQAYEHFGIAVTRKRGWTIGELKAAIDERKPVCACVEYGKMPPESKQDQIFKSGHFILVVGYENGQIVYHDSNFKGTREAEGAFRRISEPDFLKAWNTNPVIAAQYSALVPLVGKVEQAPPPPTPPDNFDGSNFMEFLDMDKAQAIEVVAVGGVFAEMMARAAKGEKFLFFRNSGGGIFVNAPENKPKSIWVPTMPVFYALGGVAGKWTQY
jgi:hypothetical protein